MYITAPPGVSRAVPKASQRDAWVKICKSKVFYQGGMKLPTGNCHAIRKQ